VFAEAHGINASRLVGGTIETSDSARDLAAKGSLWPFNFCTHAMVRRLRRELTRCCSAQAPEG